MAEPTFDVISLGPSAHGWRAIFSAGSGPQLAPLVCWGAFRKKTPGQPDQILILLAAGFRFASIERDAPAPESQSIRR